MTEAALSRIAALIDRLRAAVESHENQRRLKLQPTAVFGMEEPIASQRIYGYDVNHFFADPLFYVEQFLRQRLWRWEHFPREDGPLPDDVWVWLGHYPEYTFLGMSVPYNERGVPCIQTDHPMTRAPDLRLLQPVDFKTSGMMPHILRFYDAVDSIVAGRLRLTYGMTWGRGCLDLAVQLRGYENWVADTAERPEFVHALMQFLVEQRCRWWEGYEQHFGQPRGPVPIADDWINIPFISPAMFRDFVLPYYKQIERFHGGIASIHSCGDQTPVQKYMLELETLPQFEISPWTKLDQTLSNVPASKRLAPFLHPNDVLMASPSEMEARLTHLVTALSGARSH
ncbi:MAG: hypothetical protein GX557_01955 [Chloroflexi bacterium]|nr:hypothetical protein [Chloroflexota bacterium]